MGYYIQTGTAFDKAKIICKVYGGILLSEPPLHFSDIPEGKGLICVVTNPMFEAAAFCYDQNEFDVFIQDDGRPKEWVLLPIKDAIKLSGYKK